MKLPAAFAYNPQAWVIKWNLVIGIFIVGLVCDGFFRLVPWMIIAAFVLSSAGLLAIRRWYFPKSLILDHDAILLPVGFLQFRTVLIPYDAIQEMYEKRLAFGTTVFYFRDDHRKYELVCGMQMTAEEYIKIRDFLVQRVTRKDLAPF